MMLQQLSESNSRKVAVWQKAEVVHGFNAAEVRRDRFGNYICWLEYGLTTINGWEIDHILPRSLGGSDSIDNLFATHWKANRLKSNKFVG